MSGPNRQMEHRVGRALGVAAWLSVALLLVGVAGMALAGVSPIDRPFPDFDPTRLPADVQALRPAGFLWLGLVAVILTPAVRVVASLVGYLATGERRMASVALAVLGIICLSALVGAGG